MAAENATIVVQPAAGRYADRGVEICEHKGIGHPDTIADGACEAAARALARAYRGSCGRELPFNVDRGLLIAGRSEPRFGGGRILEPAQLIISGHASNPGGRLDIDRIVRAAAADYLRCSLRAEAPRVQIVSAVRSSSASFSQIDDDAPRANDTAIGVGFAPLSALERQVLQIGLALHAEKFRTMFPAAGDDFKIIGLRIGGERSFVVALALIDRYVAGVGRYFEIKERMLRYLRGELPPGARVTLNAPDDPNARDESGVYLTVSGLSAERDDDGQVGHGNRVNGLITPGRPMSLEAAAGTNPTSHVGKGYNVLADAIARELCSQLPEVDEATVQLFSTIGDPLDAPRVALAEIAAAAGMSASLRERVTAIARRQIEEVAALAEQIAQRRCNVY